MRMHASGKHKTSQTHIGYSELMAQPQKCQLKLPNKKYDVSLFLDAELVETLSMTRAQNLKLFLPSLPISTCDVSPQSQHESDKSQSKMRHMCPKSEIHSMTRLAQVLSSASAL
eukprot:4955064-Amphidinium_carterae.5